MSQGDRLVADLSALRLIVGTEPKEQDLVNLLHRCKGDVNAAANVFFDGGANVVDGMPIAQPSQQQTSVVSVTCPAGVTEGSEIQVQTEAGLMRVTVPKGVTPGTAFLIRLPSQVSLPNAGVAQPVGGGGQAAAGYPGQGMQPNVQYHQQQPQVVVVQGAPYGYGYGGYGYGGMGPGMGMGMGFLGGMLIADAMYW